MTLACLRCAACKETLYVEDTITVAELKNALSGFMTDHIAKHGPESIFDVPDELDGDLFGVPKG